MGRLVISCYVPKPGRETDLHELLRSHVARLRAEGLATGREPFIAVAADGSIIEVFEWVSEEAIAAAHQNATFRALWDEYEDVCTYIPFAQLPEAADLFPGFDALP
jgi:quinol monooxygenase YgiN